MSLQDAIDSAQPIVAEVPPVVPGRVLHMDGDLLCYTCGGNEDTTVGYSRTNALSRITKAREMAGAERTVLHLTMADSTKADRRLIASVKPYQGQRDSSRRPKNWGYLREFFEGYRDNDPQLAVQRWSTREADDGLAFAAMYGTTVAHNEIALCSGDKDLRMVTGCTHVDWNTYETVYVPPGAFHVEFNGKVYGHKWFWLQMLQGDTADNIPGLPRLDGKPVGPVRAEKLLHPATNNAEAFSEVCDCYMLEYQDEAADRFVEQAALLWMRSDASASIDGFMQVCTDGGRLNEAVLRLEQRIKEAHAEAEKLGNLAAQGE